MIIPRCLLLSKLCHRYLIKFLKPWQQEDYCPQLTNIVTLIYRDIAESMNFIMKYIVTEFLVHSLQSPFQYEVPLLMEYLDKGWR